jgi:hypothetical protein
MRALHGPQNHRHVAKLVVLAFEGELVRGEALEDELEGLVIDVAGGCKIEAVGAGLERRHAAPDPELEAPAAHLIEHADFLDQAQRMVERQQIDQGPETQRACALRHRREEQAGRGGTAERRRMVLGYVIAVDTAAIIGFDELKPIGIKLPERHAGVVHMVEHTEFHRDPRAEPAVTASGAVPAADHRVLPPD